jgi:lipopolysaccharide/colanic/teichoic acid biosynthesis glycosyltransferase
MDLVLASAALIVLSPFVALIVILIRLDSAGPAFFRQTRIGWKQRPFEMWKFRTMFQDAPVDVHREFATMLVRGAEPDRRQGSTPPVYKLADDSRITRVGRWLRVTSLDELPQLFNVLLGEMSLVGPRPILPYEREVSESWHFERFEMPQGMTGLWQVSGRNRLSYRRRCELDIEYVRTWSLWLDLRILAKTFRAVMVDREPLARRQRLARRRPELGGA